VNYTPLEDNEVCYCQNRICKVLVAKQALYVANENSELPPTLNDTEYGTMLDSLLQSQILLR